MAVLGLGLCWDRRRACLERASGRIGWWLVGYGPQVRGSTWGMSARGSSITDEITAVSVLDTPQTCYRPGPLCPHNLHFKTNGHRNLANLTAFHVLRTQRKHWCRVSLGECGHRQPTCSPCSHPWAPLPTALKMPHYTPPTCTRATHPVFVARPAGPGPAQPPAPVGRRAAAGPPAAPGQAAHLPNDTRLRHGRVA